ncbi:small multi-drug export protein [uncultured Parvimonas sp.]|uniref:COG2426 family protein n=1 Tax=uncultured Parvimonas sp. TaxID=747372 RepID=UPI00259A296D|nr:small multi-drug export protein [uncultured Parvimonas sp.]
MLKYFLILFISMLPVIELRGAIPYSQAMGLPILSSYIIAIIGNLIPVPFIYFLAKKLLILGENKKYIGKFCKKLLLKGHKAGEKILKKSGKSGTLIALALFIGIPFPGTGAYTGILAASILDIDFKTSFLSAIIGVILSGIIMSTISFGIF